jgi:hypothetical protein
MNFAHATSGAGFPHVDLQEKLDGQGMRSEQLRREIVFLFFLE